MTARAPVGAGSSRHVATPAASVERALPRAAGQLHILEPTTLASIGCYLVAVTDGELVGMPLARRGDLQQAEYFNALLSRERDEVCARLHAEGAALASYERGDLQQAEYFNALLSRERDEVYARLHAEGAELARYERVGDIWNVRRKRSIIKELDAELRSCDHMMEALSIRLSSPVANSRTDGSHLRNMAR